MATKKYVSLEKLGLYDEKIKKVISDGDAASLASAKSYADGLAVNYDAAGSASTAEANAKSYTDTEVAKANAAAAAAQTAADNAASAASAADGKAVQAQSDVDALETYVGTFTASEGVDTVVKYIDAKTANIASDETVGALADRVTQAEKDIDAIEADYLKATDKTELSTAINTEKERAMGVEGGLETRLAAVEDDYLKGTDKTELANAISAEKERAMSVEGGLDTRVKAIEDDYLKAADKEALQTQINTIMNNPDAEGAINSINEFTKYVEEHGTIADGFRTDIDKNKEDIAAEVKRAGEAESALSGRLDTLEAIDHTAYVAADTALKNELTTEIGKKADASVVSDMDTAYKAADTELSERINAVEALMGDGEGSVTDQIADAKTEVLEEVAADIAEAKEEVKTDASNKDAVVLAEAQKGITAVQTALDTHTNNGDIHVTAEQKTTWSTAAAKAHEHSNLAVLEGITSAKVTEWDKVSGKAEQTALQAEIERATAAEQALGARIDEFKECSQEDIEALFETQN